LNLSEILSVYLVDRLYLSVAVTYRRRILHIWSGSGTVEKEKKINCHIWKICHSEPHNLAKWPAELGKICRRKLWSLFVWWTHFCQIFRRVRPLPKKLLNFAGIIINMIQECWKITTDCNKFSTVTDILQASD